MKLMNAVLSAGLVLASLSAHAENVTVAKMKFLNISDQKVFSAQWFDEANLGYVQLGLVWDEFNDSVKNGFILDTAKNPTVISPVLPESCKLISVQGSLSWNQTQSSVVTLQFGGLDCSSFFESLKSNKLELSFSNVAQQLASKTIEKLQLNVNDLPY
jgi:hypothetical protein